MIVRQTKASSGNDILRELSRGEGGEEEIPGGVAQEAPPERKALIEFEKTGEEEQQKQKGGL